MRAEGPFLDGETRALLERLGRKYDALARLHDLLAGARDEAVAGDDRALAEEFPGALRELQTLDREALVARREAVARALADGEVAAWMRLVDDEHRFMRAALAVKRTLGRRSPEPHETAALVAIASRAGGLPVEESLIVRFARPPRGRLADVVFDAIAARHRAPREAVVAALRPRRAARRGAGPVDR